MSGEQLKGHLDSLLLSVLSDEPMHGYGVIARLRDRSGGTFDLPEGTVYPALHRLERAGLVHSYWSSDTGRRRRLYELTTGGQESLAGARADWRSFSRGVTAVLGAAG
ncbi:MAG TPA: helix-turn-helix transcriptional regulator [Acidimicrobiales bacterium]|nr:helix-turn-helix transcriptional regulator [Acidimicrobiales bacterium]